MVCCGVPHSGQVVEVALMGGCVAARVGRACMAPADARSLREALPRYVSEETVRVFDAVGQRW